MAEIRWTLTAAEDLQLLEQWIARDSPLNAVEFTDRLIGSVEILADNPRIGRVVPEFGREGLRESIFRGYRIVYSVEEAHLTILRVVHGARDLRRLAAREPWTFE
jgi:plasmid stabilization system protein ParE